MYDTGKLVYNAINHIRVYEAKETTGLNNVGGGSEILSTSLSNAFSQSFYTNTFQWSEEIWDFRDMTTGPRIK